MEFNSKIATTREQSERLLALGLKLETADMYLEKCRLPEAGDYYLHTLPDGIDVKHWFSARMNRDIIPAWSLSRLLELLPVEVPDPKLGFEPHHPELIINTIGYIVSIRRATADCLIGTHIEDSPIESCVSIIGWLIRNKYFNKEYIKTNGEN